MSKSIELDKYVNYYDHQFLTKEEFNCDQNFFLNSQLLQNDFLYSTGVIYGYDVSDDGNTTLTIHKGIAIYQGGQPLILKEDYSAIVDDLKDDSLPTNAGDLKVVLTCRFKLYIPSADDPDYDKDLQQPTRQHRRLVFTLYDESHVPAEEIKLATMTLLGGKTISKLDCSIKTTGRYKGNPQVSPDRLLLNSGNKQFQIVCNNDGLFLQELKNGTPYNILEYLSPTNTNRGLISLGDRQGNECDFYSYQLGYKSKLDRVGDPATELPHEKTASVNMASASFMSDSIAASSSASGNGNLEAFVSDESLEVGDVVSLDSKSEKVRKSTQKDDAMVIGVVSSVRSTVTGVYLIAVSGRVECSVNGAVKRGDLLTTSSKPGIASKAKPVSISGTEVYKAGTIIGKALGSNKSGSGSIDVLVMLN